ncbi:tRNA uridine-5-carboxymethylaminomethyl(34) synthesis GTPase MnmE [Rhodobacteraceae bacterium 2CG4]|uniref:tRNA modification GTPase MnmE n=1 Tax=Halovulum marinum TaxID=2662447 RepID=A0A6L5Z3T2_9RHOB|nr:tRNA uridine-5-carboxymethylaminomethyl(34) synthesis GTPase MnmE [Halovulum marinum]MSU90672.1 tRNA uridine-5-carboxymethylaminomethyl(34) synthesis GTPase MnmE [Halovulum marinum]
MSDTIAAVATARGQAGVAVVRLSGPEAFRVGAALAGTLPAVGTARVRVLRDPGTGEVLDQALVIAFADGQSFTGEKTVEFQIHGSIAVETAVLRGLLSDDAVRLAEPGEFTRRAMENGRMDLSQVEGLSDLVVAETEAQRRQALTVMRGAIGTLAAGWRKDLIRASALVEATIDFADEELPGGLADEAHARIDGVLRELRDQLAGSDSAERVRQGFEVAIVGAPNVGKSTLLNALAGREAAITSDVAGTTRDVIEVRMDLNGLAVTLLDTAGVRDTDDRVEALGVSRARERALHADLRIFLGAAPVEGLWRPGDLLVHPKADLGAGNADLAVSGLTGAGVSKLLEAVTAELSGRLAGSSVMIRLRHRQAVEGAVAALESARLHVQDMPDASDLAAEDLRVAVRRLDSLIGKVDVEALLDDIFASFCLGK